MRFASSEAAAAVSDVGIFTTTCAACHRRCARGGRPCTRGNATHTSSRGYYKSRRVLKAKTWHIITSTAVLGNVLETANATHLFSSRPPLPVGSPPTTNTKHARQQKDGGGEFAAATRRQRTAGTLQTVFNPYSHLTCCLNNPHTNHTPRPDRTNPNAAHNIRT